jgi:hypothetical protein
LKKAIVMTLVALGATFLVMAQDTLSKFNGTWKSEKGQVRKLTVKDGSIFMVEENAGRPEPILRQYPSNGEITMPDNYGVWAGATAKGKMEGNKLVVDTETKTFGNWHDEWTMAADGKSYSALRVSMGGGPAGKGGGGKGGGKGGPPEPETFTKVQ